MIRAPYSPLPAAVLFEPFVRSGRVGVRVSAPNPFYASRLVAREGARRDQPTSVPAITPSTAPITENSGLLVCGVQTGQF